MRMGLFKEQLGQLGELVETWRRSGRALELRAGQGEPWPSGSTVVLREDTALELGNPAGASIFFILWAPPGAVSDGRITVVGPDIPDAVEAGADGVPFAQVVTVSGSFENEYESFRGLRDAVYDTRLEGFSVRAMPSRQSIWCRVARRAADSGFGFANLGSALVESLRRVKEVEGAEVLFVTSGVEDVRALAPAAAGSRRVVEAMMKMYEEENFDCDTCEYQDVCDTVMDLKKIKSKLEEGRPAG